MSTNSGPGGFARGAQRCAGLAGLAVAAIGVLVLAGWAFDVGTLRSLHPSFVPMAANTAGCFVLIGHALWILRQTQPPVRWRRLARLEASLAAVVGGVTLAEYVFDVDLAIDQLLVVVPEGVPMAVPGRMAGTTALNFVLSGTALLMLDAGGFLGAVPPWLMLPVSGTSFLAVVGYLYDAAALYHVPGYTAMAAHTTVTFLLLAAGTLAARPGVRWVATFGSLGGAGIMARRLLPATVVVPVVIGWMHVEAEGAAGASGSAMGIATVTAVTVALFLWFGSLSIRTLERSEDARDRERRAGDDAIGRAHAELERRVRERTVMLEAIRDAEREFLVSNPGHAVFDPLLQRLLELSRSEYGFIDELFYTPEGKPYLIARAITDISWSEETRALYEQFLAGTLSFDNLHSLYGEVIRTGQPVIANDPPRDFRRSGIPPGQPPLHAFLGVPLYSGGEFVGVIGLANRPGGYSEDVIAFLEPMFASCGQLIGAWKIDQRRRQSEVELREANARLTVANSDLESFSYSVSHDLRAPLRAIDGYTRVLVEDGAPGLDADGRHAADVIQAEARRMGQLIDDLLAFSRLGRASVRRIPIDMQEMASSAWADAVAASGGPGERTCTVGALPSARGEPSMIRQVWRNLLDNAVKFTSGRTPARIEVGVSQAGGERAYYVRDNGVGFDMRYADKLFQVFQRLHSDTAFAGTGVGLAIVRRIVERHGGRVWAEGHVDAGATFWFTLPGEKD